MIDGTYSLLYIDVGNGYLPIGCLESNNFSEDVETLGSTTKDNNGWKTFVTTNQMYSLSFGGLAINTVFDNGDSTKFSYDMLKIIKRNRILIDWKTIDNAGFIDNGKGYITELNSDSNIGEFISFSATILGYGEPISTNESPLINGLESNLEEKL